MSVEKSIQATTLRDKADPDKGAAIDSSGRVAMQDPPNLDASLSSRAADATLSAVGAVLTAIRDTAGIKRIEDPLPVGDNNIGNVDVASSALPAGAATEATLATRATQATVAAIQSVLEAIRDTAGIKKIVDALPTGTNWIGKTAIGDGTNVASLFDDGGVQRVRVESLQKAGSYNNCVLYDNAGHAVGVVLDGSVYRLQFDGKVSRGASDLVHLDAIDTTTGKGRLKATLFTPEGDAVTFGAVPPSPESIKNAFVNDGGTPTPSNSLLVDGSGTPVVFSYLADATHDISLQEISFVLASNSVTFGSSAFGAVAGPLTTGVQVKITAGGNTGIVATLKQNEDFVNFASPGGFNWVVSSKDMLHTTFVVGGGLKLAAGTSDKVEVVVNDDIDSAGVYFKCFVKGNLLG